MRLLVRCNRYAEKEFQHRPANDGAPYNPERPVVRKYSKYDLVVQTGSLIWTGQFSSYFSVIFLIFFNFFLKYNLFFVTMFFIYSMGIFLALR